MKRFTLVVFLMFVMLFGVMVGQVFGQQMKNGLFDKDIPYYDQYIESLQICAVNINELRKTLEKIILEVEYKDRFNKLLSLQEWYNGHYNKVMEYLDRVTKDKYDDSHSILQIKLRYISIHTDSILLFQNLASLTM